MPLIALLLSLASLSHAAPSALSYGGVATSFSSNPADCSLPNVALGITATGAATCSQPSDVTGNAATASALSANPADCTLPQVALGIGANGAAACSQPSDVTGNAATASALATNPTACGAGDFVTDIAADGTLTCATPAGGSEGVTYGADASSKTFAGKVLQELKLGYGFAPSVVASTGTGSTETTHRMAACGQYLYVGNDSLGGFKVVDISSPTYPRIVGSTTPFNADTNANYVACDGGRYVYVGRGTSPGLISVIDVANPSAPVVVASTRIGNSLNGLVVAGGRLYAAGAVPATLTIFDVFNPLLPKGIGQFNFSGGSAAPTTGMAVNGKYLYMGWGTSNRFRVYDVSDPANVAETGVLNPANDTIRGVCVEGRYAYTANDNTTAGFRVIDVSNPASPVSVGTADTGAATFTQIVCRGRYVYLAENGTTTAMQIFDVSDPSTPVLVKSVSSGHASRGLAVVGRYAYLGKTGSSSSAIQVIDLGGIDVGSARIHSLEAGHVTARDGFTATGPSFVDSLNAGNLGITSYGQISSGEKLQVGTSTGTVLDNKGHIEHFGTAPTLSSCGTGPTVVGADSAFTITMPGDGTSCVVTFVKAWSNAPICSCNDRTTLGKCNVSASSTTSITLSNITASDVVDVQCQGYK